MKKQYSVLVKRIVREDIVINVMADSRKNAIDLAIDEATTALPNLWDCYDCEYLCEESDAKEAEDAQ